MATATKQQITTQTLAKPVVCGGCKTIHFEYSLSCKRCGDYLDKRDVAQDTGASNVGSKIMGAVGVCVAIAMACVLFRVF